MEDLWVFDRVATGGLDWAGDGFIVQVEEGFEWSTFLRAEKLAGRSSRSPDLEWLQPYYG